MIRDDKDCSIRELLEEREASWLASAATLSRGQSRRLPEPESDVRTAFQRDRDRILHSKSFRRLMHKTQVFIAPVGDHFRTRLTHTLEVAQIARTVGRALRLNEDLIEAIVMGHDLGHPPFGHAGERALADVFPGFRHNEQSLRVVDALEREGRGLNLTEPTRDGILRHSKGRSSLIEAVAGQPGTLEGEVVKLADGVAYINHDLDDACRAGLVRSAEIPPEVRIVLGETHARRIDTLVTDMVATSRVTGAAPSISMSPAKRTAADALREFLYQRVYIPLNAHENTQRAQHVVRTLYTYYLGYPERLPPDAQVGLRTEPPERVVADYVAAMTDRFAIDLYEQLFVPQN